MTDRPSSSEPSFEPPTEPPTAPPLAPPAGPPSAGPPSVPPPPPPPTGRPYEPGQHPESTRGPLRAVGELMTFVTRNVVDRFGHIFTLITIIAVPVLLASTPLLWFGFRDVIFLFDESGLLTDIEGLTGSLIWQAVAALVVTFAGYALMFSSVTNLLSAEEHTWREGLIGGLNGTPRVLAFGVLSLVLLFVVTIMISVFVALVPALGAVFVLLLFGLFAWYWVRTAVAFTHSSLRQPGFGLKHSFALTRGSAMALLGRMILLASIAVMVQILVSIVTGPFLGSGVEAGDRRVAVGDVLGTDPAAFMLAQILGAFGGLFAVSLWAAAMLAIFRDLHRES